MPAAPISPRRSTIWERIMGGKSVFANVMLVVIALILFLGFYLVIGAVDVFRKRAENLVTEVAAMNSEISRLREELAGGGFKPGASAGTGAEKALPKFANMELRDPNGIEGDALASAMQAESGNLNPIINNEASTNDFWGMCTDTLAERSFLNPDIFEPKLAEKWEISDDKLTYTIHLRKGVLWHDFTDPTTHKRYENVEVTADDFKFYVDVIMNPKIPCDFMRVYFQDLQGLRVLDRYTFQVTWKQRYWKSEELTLTLNPLPRHFYQFDPANPDDFTDNAERNRMIVGCGPWIFESWEKGKELAFRRNEAYYAPKPYLLRRMVKIIREPTASLQALRNGEIDRMGLQPEQWVDQIKDAAFNAKFDKFQYPARAFNFIGYNLRRDLFKDKRVRLALTHLVNRERILKEVYHDLGRIVSGPFYIDSSSYDQSVKPWPFDVDKAKALLAEAGWKDTVGDGVLRKDGKKFEFIYMTISSSKIGEQIAAIVRDDFAKAGIIVNINPVEWSIYTQRLDERNFDVCQLGWQLDWADDPYQIWHSSQADLPRGSNFVGFKNAEADRIIEEGRREFDVAQRTELYHRLHRLLHEEQPYTFLISPDALVAQDKRFRNAKVWKPMNEMYPDGFWVPLAEQKYKE
jgi:peptide/nickel transport system substrate-binding protein